MSALSRGDANPQDGVNPRLTRKRRSRDVETQEFSEMLERLVRRYGDRVAQGDPVDLERMMEVRAAFDEAVAAAVRGLHYGQDWSWSTIAAATGGRSKQAAQQRWGDPARDKRGAA